MTMSKQIALFLTITCLLFAVSICCRHTKNLIKEEDKSINFTIEKYSDINEQTNKNVSIEYPRIVKSNNVTDIINETIYKNVIDELTMRTDYSSLSNTVFERVCTVKFADQEFFSLLVESRWFTKNTPRPGVDAYTMTFDLKEGSLINLYNIYDKDSISSRLKESDFDIVNAPDSFFEDSFYEQYIKIDPVKGYYITHDKIGLLFNVNTGNYVVIEMRRSKI